MASFHLDLVSPENLVFSGEVDQVDVPGTEGDFGVLAGHAPTVATLKPGIMTVYSGGDSARFVVLGGFAEVSSKGLIVLADIATTLEEIDREVVAAQITELETEIAAMEQGNALDRAIMRLDHFKTVQQELTLTGM